MPSFLNLHDVESAARGVLPAGVADYFGGGANDEVTLVANRQAFDRTELRYRVLADVASRILATTSLGRSLTMPVWIAPMAFQRLAHPDGELAMARAAQAAGIGMVLSTFATTSLEDVRAASPGPQWFQLYVHKDRAISQDLVQRADAAGFDALVVTVDVPVLGRRERDLRNAFSVPAEFRLANLVDSPTSPLHNATEDSGLAQFHRGLRDPGFTWKDLDWIASLTTRPIVLKGVVRGDDAARALDHGVRGIIVSNHGGRQLDTAIASLRALPDVVQAVGGRAEVLVDGGVRRGTDIIKAIALGASAVLVGRPAIWALAAGGQAGVTTLLDLLRDEIDTAMALCGVAGWTDCTSDLLASLPER